MWQTILFFTVINFLAGIMVFFDYKKTAIKISAFNKILYAFFGGATGILLASKIFKFKMFSSTILTIALIENVGVYILLYKMAIYFS
jgi:uncharacterized membrane protein YsdA (DUF1294 family)